MYSQTGSVDIKDGYILVPASEQEQIQKNNPEVTVIGYDGTIALDYGNALIKILGYKYIKGTDVDFYYDYGDDQEVFYEILRNKNKYIGLEQDHEKAKEKEHDVAVDINVGAYEYIFEHYEELFSNYTDMFKAKIRFSGGDTPYYEDVLSKLDKCGIHTSSSLLVRLKKIHDVTDISKLSIEDIEPDIKKQSCESEYAISKLLTDAIIYTTDESGKPINSDSRGYYLREYFMRRAILTAIAKSKGGLEFDGDYYEPDIPMDELQKIAINRLREGTYTVEEFRDVAQKYCMKEQIIEREINFRKWNEEEKAAHKRLAAGEITIEEYDGILKKISHENLLQRLALGEITQEEFEELERPKVETIKPGRSVFDSPKMDGVAPASDETEHERIVFVPQYFSELASSDIDAAVSTIKRATEELAKEDQQEQTTDKEDKGEI